MLIDPIGASRRYQNQKFVTELNFIIRRFFYSYILPPVYPQSVHPYLHFFNTLSIFKRFQILGLVLMAHAVFQPLAGLFKAPDIKREGLLLRTVTRATVILILGEYLIDLRMGLNIYREYPISWQLYLPSV